ncbi:MAG TPA: hypothetical protein VGK19_10210 [Capsulimonadaceae bacterium]|jgi:hypothetical protein
MPDQNESFRSKPAAVANLKAQEHRARFSFAVMPDRSGNIRQGVFSRIAEQVDLMSPDFAVFIGDAIEIYDTPEDADTTEILNEQWDEFCEELKPLTRPVFFVPGWHDYKSEAHAKVYAKRIGPSYYSFDYHGCHFIVLNSYDAYLHNEASADAVWRLGSRQLDWLALDLSTHASASHTFVLVHAFYESLERQEVIDLLGKRSFDIISGSSHCYRKQDFHGTPYYQLGTAGGYSSLDGPGNGTVDHFMWVTVEGKHVKIANVLIDSVLPDDFCTEETASDFVAGEVIISGRMSLWDD